MKKLIFVIPLVAVMALIVFVAIRNRNDAPTPSGVTVVAAENFYGDIAKQIGGDQVHVTSILNDPSVDPHDYEPTARDAVSVNKASIVIANGANYDTFMDQLIGSAGAKTVVNAANVARISQDANPHIWYKLEVVKKVASEITDRLVSIDPTNKTLYQKNYATFIFSLTPLQSTCNSLKIKYAGTPVVATERVADYLLLDCGLKPLRNDLQQADEEGNDPTADALNAFRNILTAHQARVLIYNSQATSPLADQQKQVAKENNIPVVAVTETMPADSTYQAWIHDELQQLQEALISTP